MKQKFKLADARTVLTIVLMVSMALVQGVYGIGISASGGGNGESGSVGLSVDLARDATLASEIAIKGATVTPTTAISGPVSNFEETHAVKDATGKSASVYVKVVNAPNGITYSSRVLPGEGSVSTQPLVSAEQWLSVPWADSVVCNAKASFGGLSADVGLGETKGNWNVDLENYYGQASASATTASAKQTAYAASAYTFNIYGHANDGIGSYSVDTTLNGKSGINARFKGLDASSSAGTTTEVKQNEQITQSSFTSTAAYTPKVGTATTKTRTSNYGADFDLSMKAAKGSSPTGTVGYYVNPSMATTSLGAIQGGINAAEFGDTVNAVAGTYKENVKVDKSLTIKGVGAGYTIVDGNKANSVFTLGGINPNIDVTLSSMTVQNGNAFLGGGIRNYGSLTMTDIKLAGNYATYGGGIANYGKMTQNGGSIDHNTAIYEGGGIANFNSGTVNLNKVSISNNTANNAGGIYNDASGTLTIGGSNISYNTASRGGGGVYNWGKMLQTGGSIDHNTANSGAGIYSDGAGVVALEGTSLSHNIAALYGGGIYSWGVFTQNGGSISYNIANLAGGGIYNDAGDGHIGTMALDSVSIDHNNAAFGGGIYDDNYAKSSLKNTAIVYNVASIGGGVFNDLGSLLTQDGGSISYNIAKSGGGIYSDEGNVIINSGSIDHNKATTYHGGGIFVDNGGSLVVNGGSISNNIAAMYGGGVINWGAFNLNGGSIDHNQAGIDGGGVLKVAGSLVGNQALVHDNILTNGVGDNIS